MKCTCECFDDGDPENGPHLSVAHDEHCPKHGRAAQPAEWREIDDWQRGFDWLALQETRALQESHVEEER